MNIIKKICFFNLLLLFSISLYAQETEGRVVASNSDKATIILRWLLPEWKFSEEGVYVYKKGIDDTKWIKLTHSPIKKALIKEAKVILGDSTFAIWESIISNKPKEKQDIENLQFLLLLQALKEQKFAEVFGLHYEDTTVILGKTYRYKVTLAKNGSIIGISNPITVKKYKKASSPKDLKGVAGDQEVKFKWEREEKFFLFNLYRSVSQNGQYKIVNKPPIFILETENLHGQFIVPDFFYTDDTSLVNGHTYWYKLSGIDIFGRESKLSLPISIVPKDQTPPSPPTGLRTKVNNYKVFLTWESSKSNDLKGYEVYRSMTKYKGPFDKVSKNIIPSTDTLFIDEVPKVGEVYYYYLNAIDSSMNRSKSLITTADVVDRIPPPKPKIISAKGDTGKIILNWEAINESDIMGYSVFRSIKKDKDKFVLLTPKPVSKNSFVDTLPKVARNNFFYKIRSIDSSYNHSEYSNIVKVRMPDIVPPSPPLFKKISIKKGIASLDWFINPENDILGYNVLRSEGNNNSEFILLNKKPLSPSTSHYSDSIPKPLIKYYYTLVAIDSSGNVSKKAKLLVCKAPDKEPPSPPEDLKASYNKKKNEIILTWELKKEQDLMGCIIFRKVNEKTFYPITPLQIINKFIDNSIEKGNIYYYKSKTYDKVGNVSESSKVVIVNTSK